MEALWNAWVGLLKFQSLWSHKTGHNGRKTTHTQRNYKWPGKEEYKA